MNFRVGPGEKVAIIGQNGSGKSTILNLLLRFYISDSGEIATDGVPVSHLPLDEYRLLFSVVSQEPYLFLGDIADNVELTGQSAPERVSAAMATSGVADYLKRVPDGAKTQIGRNGARLSGGEKQKLTVARTLLKDAPIVILDEATSGFDVESDAYLHDVIVHQLAGKSVIMITHQYERDEQNNVKKAWEAAKDKRSEERAEKRRTKTGRAKEPRPTRTIEESQAARRSDLTER